MSDGESTLSLTILPHPLARAGLAGDYLRGSGAARAFFVGAPGDLGAYADKLHEVGHRFDRRRRELAANALTPTSAAARDRLARFVEEGGAMVTTGQQAGLFTGPLYTIYKALTTARLARRLEQRLGVLVLPVFWIASEDHDWAEVDHAWMIDSLDRLHRATIEPSEPTNVPVHQQLIRDDLDSLLAEIAQLLGGYAAANDVLKLVRESYQPGRSVAESFASMLSRLLEPYDMLLVAADHPTLKRASSPLLSRALQEAESHEKVLAARAAELRTAGYIVQVPVLERATNVFWHGPAGRERLYRTDGGLAATESQRRAKTSEWLAEIEAEPARFSPNVLLRPVVESEVFPTLSYVAGPGEMAYWAQLGPLFEASGIRPPVVYPRFSALLVDEGSARRMRDLDLTVDDLARPRHELVSRLARGAVPEGVSAALERLRLAMVAEFGEMAESAAVIDETLKRALGGHRDRGLAGVARAERAVLRALKRTDRIGVARLDRVLARLRPNGAPQERVLNLLPYLAEFGPGLVHEIWDRVDTPLGGRAEGGALERG